MPATEQTWRDLKWMHIVFGVSSAVMLVTTVWMFAADHTREWKGYQHTTSEVEAFFLTGRIDEQQTADHAAALATAEADLRRARSQMIDRAAVTSFENEVVADASRRNEESFNFTELHRALDDLVPLAEEAAKAREETARKRDEARPLVEAAQAAETALPPEPSETERAAADAAVAKARAAVKAARDAELSQIAAEEAAAEVRDEALAELRDALGEAKFREDDLAQKKKFKNAELTSALSLHGIAVGEGRPQAEIDALQNKITEIKGEVDQLTFDTDAAKTHRMALEKILRERITKDEDAANKQVAQAEADIKRLHQTLEERAPSLAKRFLGMPIIDAFDNSDLHVDQVWLPDMTINYNFSNVARFDRCITCHRSIDKTAPGTSTEPAYEHERAPLVLSLGKPDKEPEPRIDETTGEPLPITLAQVYGFDLAPHGIVDRNDVTVEGVWRETAAAVAGLQMGDVITAFDGAEALEREQAETYLLEQVEWDGKPVKLTIRRGLAHPYASHPRLDLYVGSLSPHKKEQMGCTICHDGQGSATAFKWASHTPNTPHQATDWSRKLGWFDNHHWIFPMGPKRFIESNCLKCHHDVTELSPSIRYPEPPAPKLMDGFHLVQRFGCFGCHEINGYDGPTKRLGPDLRSEPNFFAVAQELLADKDRGLTEQERAWAEQLVHHPENVDARQRLYESIAQDKQLANKLPVSGKPEGHARMDAKTHQLGEGLKDIETPGKLRKVGPSLRYVGSKNDFTFLYSWIRKPSDFRPSTVMPQFFGLWEHLDGDGLKEAKDFEPIEIRSIAQYLLNNSQTFDTESVPENANVARGKHLFQTRGCLACHSHSDFPQIRSNQGPDLSRLGGKLDSSRGRNWLVAWLRDPSSYHVRTKMPNLMLNPYTVPQINPITKEADPDAGETADAAAEIAAYLLSGEKWQPTEVPQQNDMSPDEQENLYKLALSHLEKQYPKRQAENFLHDGIPKERSSEVKGDDAALLGATTDDNRIAKQLDYVGRRTISKYGCSGCHDIPGYEDAKPIGTGLADWGRKDPSKLAFEQIGQFMATHGVDGKGIHGHGEGDDVEHGLDIDDFDADTGYFLQQLEHHNRQGFLWQKLRQPRSYDYKKTENKGYNERLRMPRFPLDATEREAVMTFVLGLVSEPPAAKYIYRGQPRQQAIVEGRQVLEKYNCGGCHTLQMDRWEFDYHPSEFGSPATLVDFPFLQPHFTPLETEESLKVDRRGLRHAVAHGMPTYDETKGGPQVLDEDGSPIEPGDTESQRFYSFVLWESALVNGEIWPAGIQNLQIRDQRLTKYPAWGGDLARYLFPIAIANEKLRNPQAKGSEAWGWLPPPLVGEGRKVQTPWLHDFLLDPYEIRPAVVLRMPKFNMSSDEATKIANYFAAADNAEYPYLDDVRTRLSHLQAMEANYPGRSEGAGRMEGALKIITDNNYCVKCHLVGDFSPGGSVTAQAPNLDQVHRRMRPEFMRQWLANPKRLLPYTGMPVNIPYKPDSPTLGGVSQELFHGKSIEQLDGVVDFLLNYDQYMKQQVSIKPLIKAPVPTEPPADAPAQEPAEDESAQN